MCEDRYIWQDSRGDVRVRGVDVQLSQSDASIADLRLSSFKSLEKGTKKHELLAVLSRKKASARWYYLAMFVF